MAKVFYDFSLFRRSDTWHPRSEVASDSHKSRLRSQKSDFNINYPLLNIKNFMAFGSYFMY